MPFWVRDGGSWKEVQAVWVRDSGSWKEVTDAWVRDAGSWKQFWQALTIYLGDLDTTDVSAEVFSFGSPNTATASVTLGTTGVLSRNGSADPDNNEWANRTVTGSSYEARLTVNSGSSPNTGGSASTGSWLGLGTEREWGVTVTSTNGMITGNWTLEIRDASSLDVLATATFNITATVTPI